VNHLVLAIVNIGLKVL